MLDHGVEVGQVWSTPIIGCASQLVTEVVGDRVSTIMSDGSTGVQSAGLLTSWWVLVEPAPEGATA